MTVGIVGRYLKKKKLAHPRRLSPDREVMGSILDERCMPTEADPFRLAWGNQTTTVPSSTRTLSKSQVSVSCFEEAGEEAKI